VRQRSGKGDFTNLFEDAFRLLGGETLFESLAIEPLGWVDAIWARRMLGLELDVNACVRLRERGISYCFPMWMIFGINLWFQTVFLEAER
jgi:hypothetical protein